MNLSVGQTLEDRLRPAARQDRADHRHVRGAADRHEGLFGLDEHPERPGQQAPEGARLLVRRPAGGGHLGGQSGRRHLDRRRVGLRERLLHRRAEHDEPADRRPGEEPRPRLRPGDAGQVDRLPGRVRRRHGRRRERHHEVGLERMEGRGRRLLQRQLARRPQQQDAAPQPVEQRGSVVNRIPEGRLQPVGSGLPDRRPDRQGQALLLRRVPALLLQRRPDRHGHPRPATRSPSTRSRTCSTRRRTSTGRSRRRSTPAPRGPSIRGSGPGLLPAQDGSTVRRGHPGHRPRASPTRTSPSPSTGSPTRTSTSGRGAATSATTR